MNNGIDVMLPEAHEAAALDRLIRLQQDHAVLDRPLTAIDMRLPDRLVFRPRTEAKDDAVTPHMPRGSNPPTAPVGAKKHPEEHERRPDNPRRVLPPADTG